MTLYKYIGNKNPTDTTNFLILEVDQNGNPTRSVGIGSSAELSNEEYLRLSSIANLEAQEETLPWGNSYDSIATNDSYTVVLENNKA